MAIAHAIVMMGVDCAWGADWLIFPAVSVKRSSLASEYEKRQENDASVDLFYAKTHDALGVLAEFVVSNTETELERFQLGLRPTPDIMLWLGRYHTPLTNWAIEYHHGAYLQTTISSPQIANWEDDGGVLPNHSVGLLLSSSHQYGNYQIATNLSAGLGPRLKEGDALLPPNVVRLNDTAGKGVLVANVALGGIEEDSSKIALFAGYAHIPIDGVSQGEARLRIGGVTGNWVSRSYRIFGEILTVSNDVTQATGAANGRFSAGYLQGEYQIQNRLTLYGRTERGTGLHGDPYLNFTPEFVDKRHLVGLRYDFARNQAIKAEISDTRDHSGDAYSSLALQWSMMLP